MIGINDMSMGDTQWFKEKYAEILNTVRRTQPDAIIYIQGCLLYTSDAADD